MKNKKTTIIIQSLLLFLLCGFSIFSDDEQIVELEIKTEVDANRGTPFYLLVKEVEKGEFLKQDYQDIVKEAFPSNEKSPPFPPHVILPGKNYTLEIVRKQEGKLLALYFLYTQPGQDWKLLVDSTTKLKVVLGENQISKVKIG